MKLELKEQDNTTSDSLTLRAEQGMAWIEIENPWSGDTETGFGRGGSFTITKEQAKKLADALNEWAMHPHNT